MCSTPSLPGFGVPGARTSSGILSNEVICVEADEANFEEVTLEAASERDTDNSDGLIGSSKLVIPGREAFRRAFLAEAAAFVMLVEMDPVLAFFGAIVHFAAPGTDEEFLSQTRSFFRTAGRPHQTQDSVLRRRLAKRASLVGMS